MHLLDLIKSLSLLSQIFVVGIISAIIALATSWIRVPIVRWIFLYSIPMVLAYVLYWSPVWFGGVHSDEYAAWQLICIVPGGAGILASSIVSDFIQRRLAEKSKPGA